MQLTKETLRVFLDERPAIESSGLCRHAGVHERAIAQLYSLNRNLTDRLKGKLLKVIHLYGWKYCIKCGANGALKDGFCYGCDNPLVVGQVLEVLPDNRGIAHEKCAEEFYGSKIAED